MLATVRNRRGIVASVDPFDGDSGRIHLVHIEYNDHGTPTDERLLWELEPGASLEEPNALPNVAAADAMPAEDFDALLRAARWTALSPYLDPDGDGPLSRQPVASPFHGGVCVEDYQLFSRAGPERREAEARFVHGHLLKPGDVVRTDWRLRCAQPPYDQLLIPRADIPEGVVLSREGDAWIREEGVEDVALPLYQGLMFYDRLPNVAQHLRGSGRRAEWRNDVLPFGPLQPQFLIAESDYHEHSQIEPHGTRVGIRSLARATDARTVIAGVIFDLPAGNSVNFLTPDDPVLTPIEAFLAQNHGEGWMLPETLRLADYGLGHDDRAQQFQPVASRLGPRFYDWQLVQTAEESYRECHLHARNLLGADGYARLLSSADEDEPEESLPLVAEPRASYGPKEEPVQQSLFAPGSASFRASKKEKPS